MSESTLSQRQLRLYVSWRGPSGSIHPIGMLIRCLDDDRFVFGYLKLAEQLDGFDPLPGLPDLHRRYESTRLFPVFANRIMPRRRPEFDSLVRQAHLATDADPFEVFMRTGGRRATDRIEVFSPPVRTADGRSCCLFFVRGIRHIHGAAETVSELSPGQHLLLKDELDNPFNPRALLLIEGALRHVGWVPDYLVEHIHELRQLNDVDPTVLVEHVNDVEAPPHMRLLCSVSAPWPDGYQPFSEARFQPLVDLFS
jgi:hypothetical protein